MYKIHISKYESVIQGFHAKGSRTGQKRLTGGILPQEGERKQAIFLTLSTKTTGVLTGERWEEEQTAWSKEDRGTEGHRTKDFCLTTN